MKIKKFASALLAAAVVFSSQQIVMQPQSVYAAATTINATETYGAYSQLTYAQKCIYKTLLTYLNNISTSSVPADSNNMLILNFTSSLGDDGTMTSNQLWNAMFAVITDHPELYYLSKTRVEGSAEYDKSKKQYSITAKFYLVGTKSEISAMSQTVANAVAEVKKTTDTMSTTYAKLKYIHDYVCNTADYDASLINDRLAKENRAAWSAAGVFVNHKATSAGFAAAFNLLAKNAGIISTSQVGSYVSGGSSTSNYNFNVVKLNTGNYIVDCTQDGKSTKTTYDYFLKGTKYTDSVYKNKTNISLTVSESNYSA